MQPELIDVTEAARIARVDPKTIRRWYRKERITKYKTGTGRVMVDQHEVEALLEPVPVGGAR